MNPVRRLPWQGVALTVACVWLIAGCGGSHSNSTPAAGTPGATYAVSAYVAGLAGSNLVLQNNGTDNLNGVAGTTAFSTTLTSGSAYKVTVLTQPSAPAQVCSVTDGAGTIGTQSVVVLVSCITTGRYAYVANKGSQNISAFAIDASTGALSALASSPIPIVGSVSLQEAKIDPSGAYLYVVDNGANAIFGFSISPTDGSLTAVSNPPTATGKQPVSLAFDSTGAYLYVANAADNTISGYSRSTTTGVLTPLAGSPYKISGANPAPGQMVRAGNYLYVANTGSNSVDVYFIATATGALTEGVAGSPFATDTGPYSIAVDPQGLVAYVANTGQSLAGSISAFTIDSESGILIAVGGNPLPIPVSKALSIDRQSKFLFVTETGGVAVYPIVNTATGLLGTLVAGSPFTTGGNPYSVRADPTDQFVYVGNDATANVSQFTFDSGTGVLTSAGALVNAGTNPDFIAID